MRDSPRDKRRIVIKHPIDPNPGRVNAMYHHPPLRDMTFMHHPPPKVEKKKTPQTDELLLDFFFLALPLCFCLATQGTVQKRFGFIPHFVAHLQSKYRESLTLPQKEVAT